MGRDSEAMYILTVGMDGVEVEVALPPFFN